MTFNSSYTYDLEQFRMLARARTERAGGRRWHRYGVVLGLFLAAIIATLWGDGELARVPGWSAKAWHDALWIVAEYGAGLALFIAAIDLMFDRLITALIFRRYSVAGKRLDITLADEGVSYRSVARTGTVAWPGIKAVTVLRDRTAAVLWLSKIEGILLPAASFGSREEFAAACQFIEEKSRAAS